MSHTTNDTEAAATSKHLVSRTANDTVAASPATVWHILSDDFLEISNWAGGVRSSSANPATPTGLDGSPHGGRVCDVDGIGITDERIVAFDPNQRTLTYTVSAKKIPFFVESMTSSWSVHPGTDDSHSSVTLTVTATTKGLFGRVGKIPLTKMISGAAPGLLADLKTWAETPDTTTVSGPAAS